MSVVSLLILTQLKLPAAVVQPPIEAVQDLIRRRVPQLLPFLELEVLDAFSSVNGSQEHFKIMNSSSCAQNISIVASSTSALATGVHHYLRFVALRHISWNADNLPTIAVPPPRCDAVVAITALAKWRYAWNVCTHGYTMAWWDWARWEVELDFMALSGVNLPLLFTGQEYVLARVFRKFANLTEADLQPYFSGFAFLPWQRMGNEAGWGGPLTAAMRQAQWDLQLKIVRRARDLGMTPVLPCFGGNVPKAFAAHFPHANFTSYPPWNNFPNESMLLDPTDPLFVKFGRAYTAEQISLYSAEGLWGDGIAPVFNCDVWMNDRHNWQPAASTTAYLAAAGAAMVDQLSPASTLDGGKLLKPTWLNQGGWMFRYKWWQQHGGTRVRDYLSRVPDDQVLILELSAEAHGVTAYEFTIPGGRNYWGKNWIYCMIHNFGQRPGMHGDLPLIATAPHAALKEALPQSEGGKNGTCIGIGITPEGIEQNPVMYEFMLDRAWSEAAPEPTDYIEKWTQRYATRRYGGRENIIASKAWTTLSRTVYGSAQKNLRAPNSLICDTPTVHVVLSDAADGDAGGGATAAWIALAEAINAPNSSLKPNASLNEGLLYDIIDLGRECVNGAFAQLQALYSSELLSAAQAPPGDAPHQRGPRLAALDGLAEASTNLLMRMDDLLATQTATTLGRWLHEARMAAVEGSEELFEYQARNQIVMWGPSPESGPRQDYAAKHWSGLIARYYAPRWATFHATMRAAAAHGHSVLTPAQQQSLTAELDAHTHAFCAANDSSSYPVVGTGGAKTLHETTRLQELIQTLNKTAFDARWRKIPHADHRGSADTLNYVQHGNGSLGNDIGRLAYLCESHPRCVAFNSNGWLKSNSTVDRSGATCSSDFYVRL